MREDLKPLFTPYKIKNMEMKNRFFMPPMALICDVMSMGPIPKQRSSTTRSVRRGEQGC